MRMSHKIASLILLVLIMAAFLNFSPPTTAQEGEALVFRYAMLDDMDTTNFLHGDTTWDWDVYGVVLDWPFARNWTNWPELIPWIGSWTIENITVPDGWRMKITVKLREGVLFHDGTELTAEDCVFMMNMTITLDIPLYSPAFYRIAKVYTVDKYTFALETKTNTSDAWVLPAVGGPIYPKWVWKVRFDLDWDKLAYYKEHPDEAASFLHNTLFPWEPAEEYIDEYLPEGAPNITTYTDPVTGETFRLTFLFGTGPFIFKKRVPGAYIELIKNPNYWAKDYLAEIGVISPGTEVPKIDKLVYSIITNPDAQLLALKKGEIDYMGWYVPPASIEAVKALPDVDVVIAPAYNMYYFSWNMRFRPFSDYHFRKAFAHCVNQTEIVEKLLLGYGYPLDAPLPKEVYSYWYNDEYVVKYEFDIDKANEILDKYNFTDTDGDGIRNDPETGENLEFELMTPSYDPIRVRAGEMIAAWAAKAGIKVVAKPTDFSTIVERVFYSGNFEAWILGWGLGVDPDFLYYFFHSAFTEFPWAWNPQGFVNSTFDMYADRFMEEMDPEKNRQENVWPMLQILTDALPYIPLYSRAAADGIRAEWKDYVVATGGILLWYSYHFMYKVAPPPKPTLPYSAIFGGIAASWIFFIAVAAVFARWIRKAAAA